MDPVKQQLKRFNQENRPALQDTARALLEAGIRRIHFGLDFCNDESEPAEYAVVDRADGQTEVLDHWHPLLDMHLFYKIGYTGPYTFEVENAQVKEDRQGGSVDTEECVIRVYHTPEQREALEELAGDFEEEMGFWEFQSDHFEDLQDLADLLKARGLVRVYFGVDHVEGEYPMSAYTVLEHPDGTQEELDHFADFMNAGMMADLPQFGAFVFEVQDATVSLDPEGGLVHWGDSWSRAYHTEAQREFLGDVAALQSAVSEE